MDDAAADLQTSLRATMGATEEIFDISYIRQQNTKTMSLNLFFRMKTHLEVIK